MTTNNLPFVQDETESIDQLWGALGAELERSS